MFSFIFVDVHFYGWDETEMFIYNGIHGFDDSLFCFISFVVHKILLFDWNENNENLYSMNKNDFAILYSYFILICQLTDNSQTLIYYAYMHK